MSDKVIKKTKAQLHEMLAEAVRNTQPQPVNAQPEPVRDAQPESKRNSATHDLRQSARSRSKELAAKTETLHR
jgi:hypothetical protein